MGEIVSTLRKVLSPIIQLIQAVKRWLSRSEEVGVKEHLNSSEIGYFMPICNCVEGNAPEEAEPTVKEAEHTTPEEQQIAQAHPPSMERDRKWEARLAELDAQRQRMQNDYTAHANIHREDEETRRSKERIEESIRETQNATARALEESRKMRSMQMRKIFELVRNALWSQQAEAQWSDRLLSLRKCHDPVRLRFESLCDFVNEEMQRGGLGITSCQHILGELSLLKEELGVEIQTMEEEVMAMKHMKIECPGTEFLTDIEESASMVAEAACSLLREIEELETEDTLGAQPTVSIAKMNNCKRCFDKLEKRIEQIPTVMGLKEKYQHHY